jgi:hypothetical protein
MLKHKLLKRIAYAALDAAVLAVVSEAVGAIAARLLLEKEKK